MELIRPVGPNEKRCAIREHLKLYTNIVTVATYAGPLEFSYDNAVRSLKACLDTHPTLSSIVRDADTENPSIWRVATVDIRKHLHFDDDDDNDNDNDADNDAAATDSLQQLIRDIHQQPMPATNTDPQWHMRIVRLPHQKRFLVAFSSSHALADGFSGTIVHQTFLEALRRGPAASPFDATPIHPIRTDRELPAPLEQAARLSISWSFLLGPLLNEYGPRPLVRLLGLATTEPPQHAWFGASARPPLPNPAATLPTAVHVAAPAPATLMPSILARCRLHDTRLTALLHILTARSLARALRRRRRRCRPHASFVVQTPLDLRRCLPQCARTIGNYASAATETVTVADADADADALTPADWESARAITARLGAAAGTLADQPVALLRYLADSRAWLVRNAGQPPDVSVEISNLGAFDDGGGGGGGETEEGWRVEDLWFSQSANAVGPPLNFNVASVKGGCLRIVVTWWPGMLGLEDEEAFVAEVCGGITEGLGAVGSE